LHENLDALPRAPGTVSHGIMGPVLRISAVRASPAIGMSNKERLLAGAVIIAARKRVKGLFGLEAVKAGNFLGAKRRSYCHGARLLSSAGQGLVLRCGGRPEAPCFWHDYRLRRVARICFALAAMSRSVIRSLPCSPFCSVRWRRRSSLSMTR